MSKGIDTDKWIDISSEKYRTYVFPDMTITIEGVSRLYVSDNGHRVLDKDGTSHYIPKGWRHLYWKADPPFVY
jgi:hypothetical protein